MENKKISFEEAAKELVALKNEEYEGYHIFTTPSSEFVFYYKDHLIACRTNTESGLITPREIHFSDLAKAAHDKYGFDLTLPYDCLSNEIEDKIEEIGFECFATGEMRKIGLFVIDNRAVILERERKLSRDASINKLFEALEVLRITDPDNSWNVLYNGEVLDHETYARTKAIGKKE